MSTELYGHDGQCVPVLPQTAPASITAGASQLYEWTSPMKAPWVHIDPTYTGELYCAVNVDTASLLIWNFVLGDGHLNHMDVNDKIVVKKIAIYAATANATHKTHFQVLAYDWRP